MAKTKLQKLIPANTKRKKRSGAAEVDPLGEDGWVVVKKQKVTIIIPPSPVSKQLTMPNAAETQQPPTLTGAIGSPAKFKAGTHSQMHSAGEREKSKSLTPEKTSLNATVIPPQSILLFPPLSPPGHKLGSQNLHVDRSRGHKVSRVCSSTKVIKRLGVSADRTGLLNQRLRSVILEKKLKRAGGLSNWLGSLGLGHFVKIFQCKNVNKFHLASLTMEKLKDMGAYAVGPRRKLLHAIDCLCQPYCFEHP